MNIETTSDTIRKVALLGNHLPRQCGIAAFTTDLADGLLEVPGVECTVLAMNDGGRRHAYPERVRFEIAENDLASYRRAADFLNVNEVDVLCLQHEYGIFGGKAGGHVLALLRELRMPIVTTLHTILAEPDILQRHVMDEIVALSERLVVMSELGIKLLRDVHDVPAEKIDLIHHGIPRAIVAPGSKDRVGVEGRPVILTFGLLSPDKGIEYVIDALPGILAHHPDAVYIVLGVTHPHVKERSGESYRLALEHRAQRLGVAGSLIFHNRFVSQVELGRFLAAADIYVTPYLKAEQSTSGTLAYAVGTGKAVISTPYWYARELLAEDRGILVGWRDPQAIAREVSDLIGNPARRRAYGERAAAFGQQMLWPVVARRYLDSFARARAEHSGRLRAAFQARTLASRPVELPDPDLTHLDLMTDGTGILEHAEYSVHRYEEGYRLDDNARALLVMTLLEDAGPEDARAVRKLSTRYLAFVNHSFDRGRGRFRNNMSYERLWLEDAGSEDSHGRALWTLGTVVGRSYDPGRQSLGGFLFHAALPVTADFQSPRAWAYALLGIEEYLRAFQGDRQVQAMRRMLADRLMERFQASSAPEWPWFEDRLSVANARLPQALITSGAGMDSGKMAAEGLRSLEWLAREQLSPEGYFAPVGSHGIYRRGGERARFDQQPVEACAMVSACLEARRVTGDPRWQEHANRAFAWFLGQNELQTALYDPATGGCHDGLQPDRVNENQGAGATLSFLLALAEMRAAGRPGARMAPLRAVRS